MKRFIGILMLGLLISGCVTTSKYQVGKKMPDNWKMRAIYSVANPQYFHWKELEVYVKPDLEKENLMITVNRPKGSRVNDMSYSGELRVDIIYCNQDREIIHVIHKQQSVISYPLNFSEPMPRNLEVKYMAVDWYVKWWS
jgi:hypothetical protein